MVASSTCPLLFLGLSFTFALWAWRPYKRPPPPTSFSLSLSDSSDKRECPSFCLSLFPLPSQSLTPSFSLPPSLSPALIRYTDSSFQWTSFKRRLLPWVASSASHPILSHSFLIIKYFCNINSHECVLLGVQEGEEEAPLLLIWAQPRGR